jgi:hypothetical protein
MQVAWPDNDDGAIVFGHGITASSRLGNLRTELDNNCNVVEALRERAGAASVIGLNVY